MSVSLEIGRTGNKATVTIGQNTRFHFSYETCIAFYTPETGLVVRENEWGTTTGKHLNSIDGGNKAGRVSGTEFEIALEKVTRFGVGR